MLRSRSAQNTSMDTALDEEKATYAAVEDEAKGKEEAPGMAGQGLRPFSQGSVEPSVEV